MRFFKLALLGGSALLLSALILLAFWIYRIDARWSPLIEPRITERQQFGSIRILANEKDGSKKWVSSLSSGRLEERKVITLENTPPLLVQAIVRLEDPRFLNHEGFDVWGILRAAFAVVRTMRFSQGGSTITQQLVKNIFLSHEKTLYRKFTEIVLAALVEKRFSKDEILEAYLNEIYLGQLGPLEIHGVGRASEYYFSRSIEELELHQMALLAAVIASPGYYSPWRNPERAKARRERVLRTLLNDNLILQEEFVEANQRPLPPKSTFAGPTRANYLMDALRSQLLAEKGEEAILRGGFDIEIDLDLELQNMAEGILRDFAARNPEHQALLVAADPYTCTFKVYAGGSSYRETQLDRIRQSKRSIGSLIKPLETLRLLDDPEDPLTLASVLEDRPLEWNYDQGRGSWEPVNYDRKFRGPVRFRKVLEDSLNVPIARIFFEREPSGLLNRFFDPVRALGLEIPFERALPSAVLGAIEQRPHDVLEAYVKLVRQAMGWASDSGDFACRLAFEEREDPIVRAENTEAFGQIGANLVLSALEGGLRRGTSRWLGRQLSGNQAWAGKTGTSSDKKDAWYVALSNRMVVLAWTGKDDNSETQFTGASGALPLTAPIIRKLSQRDLFSEGWQWPVPLGLSWEVIRADKGCRLTGRAARDFSRRFDEALDPTRVPQELMDDDGNKLIFELFDETKLPANCSDLGS